MFNPFPIPGFGPGSFLFVSKEEESMKDIKFTEEIEQEFFHHQYTWHNFAL